MTIIRPLRADDFDDLYALRARNREFFRPWEPLGIVDQSRSDARAAFDVVLREDAVGESYAFGIFEDDGGPLVGRARLTNVFRGAWQNANLGYYVGEEFCGRGHATRAVIEIVRFAFKEADLHRVQAAVIPRNERSIRVMEKAGFRKEGVALHYLQINGVWEDHAIYAITSD